MASTNGFPAAVRALGTRLNGRRHGPGGRRRHRSHRTRRDLIVRATLRSKTEDDHQKQQPCHGELPMPEGPALDWAFISDQTKSSGIKIGFESPDPSGALNQLGCGNPTNPCRSRGAAPAPEVSKIGNLVTVPSITLIAERAWQVMQEALFCKPTSSSELARRCGAP